VRAVRPGGDRGGDDRADQEDQHGRQPGGDETDFASTEDAVPVAHAVGKVDGGRRDLVGTRAEVAQPCFEVEVGKCHVRTPRGR
jgi:hypothetical protein